MTLRVPTVLWCVSVAACGSGTAPTATELTGTYRGPYDAVFQAHREGVLGLVGTADSVRGTLTTTPNRFAVVYGAVVHSYLSMTIGFLDVCGGGSTALARIEDGGRKLTGSFTISGGCEDSQRVSFTFTKQ
jgi:hypothetical protein